MSDERIVGTPEAWVSACRSEEGGRHAALGGWPTQLVKSMIGACIIWQHQPRRVEVRDHLRTAGAELATNRTVHKR